MSQKRKGIAALSAAGLLAAAGFVGGWEGLETKAYLDPIGIPTVCYGETRGVALGDHYSAEECREMLALRLAEFDRALGRCLHRDLPEGMRIALLSWAYNVGQGAACRSTLVRKANAGDLRGACHELPRWNRAGGRVLRGLTNRRMSEREMCLAALL